MFKIGLYLDTSEPIFFKLGMIINVTMLYILIPV